jgi:hypothetical protein
MRALTWQGERDVRVEQAPHAHQIFQQQRDNRIKVLLQP